MLASEGDGIAEDYSQAPICDDDVSKAEGMKREGWERGRFYTLFQVPAVKCRLSMPVEGIWRLLENVAIPEVQFFVQAGEASQIHGQS